MSIERGAQKYGSLLNAENVEKHTAGPRSVGGLQQTNCPKTKKPEHVNTLWDGKFQCDGCGAEILFDAVGNR